jgi:hypothetical protein
MTIVLIKNGKRVAAFYNPKGSGHIEIDYDSPLATIYKMNYKLTV